MTIKSITDDLIKALNKIKFSDPVSFIYNPLEYARKPYDLYFEKYGGAPKSVLLLGMNPGPFGMAQTGVPFGEVTIVKEWLQISAPVKQPSLTHPKRPIEGFNCQRSEVSGQRLWGWAKDRFETPEKFFSRFFVLNYCPLIFMEESSRNRTPDKLKKDERDELFAVCDDALQKMIEFYSPEWVVGIGAFAEKRAINILKRTSIKTGRILHPSPASPKANKGWVDVIEKEFKEMEIEI